ncbi:putative alcohol dehydrogenase [Mytilinidion resinicola]|uniref:Alcohol dehydrogenase n=1 Tax=Mytilinidion resinicola TaxID=574789 RepID=A0A6A6Z5S5_9PEZI|nr:putative alcohol dehydrogenase [Mytilinidion resinicola]KAF2816462.1 putative alcohol dehydrogenase [Mytilinidion resinicola]
MPSEWQIHNATRTSWTSLDALSNLRLNTNVPKPTVIPPKTALVRMKAAALNARDFMVLAHDPIYPGNHVNDLVPCADGAGEVEAIGEGSQWKVGDKVLVHPNAWIDEGLPGPIPFECPQKGADNEQGTLREYAVWEDSHLISAPSHLTFAEMAAMPACGATSVNALFHGPEPLKAGMTVLTQGTGGVSCFAIQLASAIGARVIATSSSDAKLELAKMMGATHLINYRTHANWEQEVLRLTNGKGVDLVVDVAGSGTIEQSLAAVKFGGQVSLVGFMSESKKTDLVLAIILGGKTVRGVANAGSKAMAEQAAQLAEKYKIHPVVATIFEWEDAKEAFAMLNAQSAVGKIVIKI